MKSIHSPPRSGGSIASRQASVHVDLDAIAHNFAMARERAAGRRIMAVVKADAYGHGAAKVAKALARADCLGVARVSEALDLREAGVGGPICLLEGVASREELNIARDHELDLVVHDRAQLSMMEQAGARRRIWLKVDTGMGRLGVRPERIDELVSAFGHQRPLGLMTHLANADDVTDGKSSAQYRALVAISRKLQGRLDHADVLSVANSAGLLGHPEVGGSWVRPGLMLYGASPFDELVPIAELMPAMTFTAPVIAVREVRAGESVGYGGLWTAPEDTRVGVIAAGYADGYPREVSPGVPVLVGGQERKLIGRVSMDMICVALEAGDRVAVNDRVVLWGKGLPIERIAKAAGTVPYTLMCGVTRRVRREHLGGMGRRGYG